MGTLIRQAVTLLALLTLITGAIYPLAEARRAFTAKSSQKVAGKIILQS